MGSVERREVVRLACNQGEKILKDILDLGEEQVGNGAPITLAMAVNSPLQPFWVSESNSLLFYTLTKSACVAGFTSGTGFIITRLPSPHPTIIKWSAPCFVTISLKSFGFSFGRRSISSFTACMTKDTKMQLAKGGKISVLGFDIASSCGSSLQHRAELLGGSCSGGMMGTVGVNKVSGSLFDFSFAGGGLQADTQKNAGCYGADASVLSILDGKVPPPGEMQQLYSSINSIVNHVERTSCPSRVSASLERLTAGYDPERRIVLEGGSVIREDGVDPLYPGSGSSSLGPRVSAQQLLSNTSGKTRPLSSTPSSTMAQVDQGELERLRAAAAENSALKAQLESLQAAKAGRS